MQNKSTCANGAEYVNLNARWMCNRCGCMNQGCDCCTSCGWNRCGCQGGVVYTTKPASRQRDCDACPAATMNHTVQECPCNTYVRSFDGCGCNGTATTNQTRCCDCNGTAVANQIRTCGCTDTATANQPRTCGCAGTAAANQPRTCGCSESRERTCGCNNTAAANQSRTCGCSETRERNCTCNGTAVSSENGVCTGLGIVHAVEQELNQVFESESALRTGTLFPELHKPMNGRCPGHSNCSTPCQQSAFAAWDLRLYLDTHPDDEDAKALFRRLCEETDDPNYATTFLTEGCCDGQWRWHDQPWPWECRPCNEQ